MFIVTLSFQNESVIVALSFFSSQKCSRFTLGRNPANEVRFIARKAYVEQDPYKGKRGVTHARHGTIAYCAVVCRCSRCYCAALQGGRGWHHAHRWLDIPGRRPRQHPCGRRVQW